MSFYTLTILNALLTTKYVLRTLRTPAVLIFFSPISLVALIIPLQSALSDFHKMIVTVQKYTFVKAKSKVILYRCYKTFNNNLYRNELKESLPYAIEYVEFENT